MNDTEVITVGGSTSFDLMLQFASQSVVVNNYSNQWVELPGIRQFVPPYWVGACYVTDGANRAVAKFNAPTGIPQAATIPAQNCVLIFYPLALPPNPGQPITVRAPSTEWRNPKELVFSASNAIVGPTGFVTDFTYTVPSGRRAKIDYAQCIAELVASDGSGSGVQVSCGVFVFPLGGAGGVQAESLIFNGTVQGARADVAISSSKELQATDVVQAQRINARGAGVTALFVEAMQITEGDA